MTVTLRAYAKINLYLDVLGKRADGYHDLATVMQTVSLYDTLTFTRRTDDQLEFAESRPSNIPPEKNLVMRAARAYFAASGAPFGVDITLDKQIPMQAGMGGGSADAAAVLRGLNSLDHHRFDSTTLAAIGAKIGADVPFCVMGGTALCHGIGERITPVKNNLRAALVVAIAGEGVSTPAAFAALDEWQEKTKRQAPAPDRLLAALADRDLKTVSAGLYNAFEPAIEPVRPAVTFLKSALLSAGATASCMSGSGPSVYGLFADDRVAASAAEALREQGITAYACHFVAYD